LAKVGRLDFLRRVFGEVFVPEEVKVEVVDKGKLLGMKDAYLVERAIGEGWIKVHVTEVLEVPIKLERGEAAALSLAKRLGMKEVLVDEVSARAAARLMDLTPRGTIFVLLEVLERKMLDLDGFLEVLDQLIRHGFRLKEEVYVEAVKTARRIIGET
jgi:predicted nucleic acid-binding protein